MCGIAGATDGAASSGSVELAELAKAMAGVLTHRGPDDRGVWADPDIGVALSHRRLSILDLSERARQPMISACGRYVLTYNGEIYNFRDLRVRLSNSGYHFTGTSDTEVVLGAIATWGIQPSLDAFNGMFAFAVWDRRDRVLWLARDRFGEKPLYYAWQGARFLFGSELRALQQAMHPRPRIDPAAVALLVQYKCIPAPYSVYEGVHKLSPGSFIKVVPMRPGETSVERYWCPEEEADAARAAQFKGSIDEAVEGLEAHLGHAVRRRMVADVPLGAFLSGGIDSSTVVAIMQRESAGPVRTFSIGFTDPRYNEAPYAKAVADWLGTDHTEHYVEPHEALELVPRLPQLYDEPFADSSQLPTHLVSALARQHVTVTLTGDGGDELFGGYPRYHIAANALRRTQRIPAGVRRGVRRAAERPLPPSWERAYGAVRPFLPRRIGDRSLAWLVAAATTVLSGDTRVIYGTVLSDCRHPERLVLYDRHLPTPADDIANTRRAWTFFEQMMLTDTRFYLTDDILTKVDRASMAVSLEVRVPFLDPDVYRFAWSLPLEYRADRGIGKIVLRRVLESHIPPVLLDRPKMGFGVPLAQWLRGPLKDWAETFIEVDALARSGIFRPAEVARLWQEHTAGTRNHENLLWSILMLQAWCAEYT